MGTNDADFIVICPSRSWADALPSLQQNPPLGLFTLADVDPKAFSNNRLRAVSTPLCGTNLITGGRGASTLRRINIVLIFLGDHLHPVFGLSTLLRSTVTVPF